MTRINDMLASVGRKEFLPNVRVIYKENTFFAPVDRSRFANPLYGGSEDKVYKFRDELDERAYERTILRHSSFFGRMRNVRRDVEMSGPYILGEREVHDIPDYGAREIICEAMYGFERSENGTRKWILIPEEGVFEIVGEQVRLLYTDPIIPYVCLENGRQTCSTVSPITDGFTQHGLNGNRLWRMYAAENLEDRLTENGGSVSFEFSTGSGGTELERILIEIDVFPMADIDRP